MLKSRNLDDQSFDQIMEYVMGRLPWLCPAWTDYNAHDPGITVLELMAWYKEMQQYHLNAVTDEMRKKLLKLLGVMPKKPKAARCYIEIPQSAGEYPAYARLESPQDITFELTEAARGGEKVQAVYLHSEQGITDMTHTLEQPGIAIWPFDQEGTDTELIIGVSGEHNSIRLWFEVDDVREVQRNPFVSDEQSPRELDWSLPDGGELKVRDETHALSHSGYVTIESQNGFPLTDAGLGLSVNRYIKVRQTDAGCEERVRLSGILAGRYPAVQRETWAKYEEFTLSDAEQTIELCDSISQNGDVLAFIREEAGLRLCESVREMGEKGPQLRVYADFVVQDGQPNLVLVTLDPVRGTELAFASTGLPNMELELDLSGRQVLTDHLALICDTRCDDGRIRPALWKYVDDLSSCGPRDCAFTYDSVRETLVFGDGEHGQIVPAGEHGVLAASLAVSRCEGGNLPANSGLAFDDGLTVVNSAASGGAREQSVADAAFQFLRAFQETGKCASEKDYERAALLSPGLRVAAAKAIAGFDPDEPSGKSRLPVVTVVALPFSTKPQPMPDSRFLNAIQRHIETKRPICTVVKVVPPVYVPIGISVTLRASGDMQAQIRQAAEEYLHVGGDRSIGDPVLKDDLLLRLSQLDGAYLVERLELQPFSADCSVTPNGDITLKRNAIAWLKTLHVQVR